MWCRGYVQLLCCWNVSAHKTKTHQEEGERERKNEYEVLVWSVDEVVACTYQEDYCHSQLQEKKPVSNKRSSARLQVKHESRRKEKNWVHGNDAAIRITFARTYLNFSWQLLKLVWSLMLSLISLWRPTHSLSLLQIDRWRQPCIDARTWRSRKISRW